MRKFTRLMFLISFSLISRVQAQIDTAIIGSAEKIIALQFTQAEKDSMQDGLKDMQRVYEKMHSHNLDNHDPYALAFNPALPGKDKLAKQIPLLWNLPQQTILPANRNDLAYFSVLQLASLLKNKKISSVELTQFFLSRLKKWGDTLHCVISLTEEIAMQQAKAADAEIARGIYRGPLHGIPYGLKDLFAVKGTHTTWGAAPYQNQILDEDAFVYSQLKNAGAVLCAKLSLGALAMDDTWFGGKTRNPWNLETGSSGSSAGSAASTVAGLLPFAIGTETWGSIVSPSHVCGATGLRPTFGSVSRSGAMVLAWSLDKIGPICRNAEDCAVVFSIIKGSDGKDAAARERSFNYSGYAEWKKWRVAYAGNYFRRQKDSALLWAALEQFKKLGADVHEIEFPDSTLYPFGIMDPIIGAECAAAFDAFTRNGTDDRMTEQHKYDWPNQFRTARFIPAVEYINANRHRYALIKKMHEFMRNIDILIVPTFEGHQLAITNLTGNPVVTFPVGFGKDHLPQSITLLGNLYQESVLLAAAKAFQDATPFNKLHPALFKN
jgi:Asp-tRNA(Asn)/Glu-tRNA(Gln) amidotransferase A subunit family amidase